MGSTRRHAGKVLRGKFCFVAQLMELAWSLLSEVNHGKRAPVAPMLRITQVPLDDVTVIGLEGRLIGPWVEAASAAIAMARARGAVRLNLQQLTFADAPGIHLLKMLRAQGVGLIGGSAFIEILLAR